MPYEPGSTQCRVLIDCKAQIEGMLLSLERIENSRHIRDQLVAVHNQLEGLHELHRSHPEGLTSGSGATG
ncbi:hypothetical protein [Synechococcus sp. CCY 9618]|uniref:hypothetical protein n=1 Tax=Synechococcus sp. CCY 9618 TaxID=2815602 RepID=UPI001C24AFA4|nr:hypothetical protein [Synechococcus sp. CCY 9618]